jgi:selenocysteine-specific elongation factor
VADLLASLERAAGEVEGEEGAGRRDEAGPVRLPIDRVFSIEGIGTVVTGTLSSGTIRVGDSLVILPRDRAIRVRQVEVHDETVPAAIAGQRTAVAIHGVSRDEVARGDWLVTPGRFLPGDTLDVRLTLLTSVERPLANRSRVRVHLGASETLGRVVLFAGRALAPGESAPAQLRLEGPVVAIPGDRLVIRSYSPSVTIAGATVLDPRPAKRSRLDEAGTDRLERLETGTLEDRIEVLAREARLAGLTPEEAALRLGVGVGEIEGAVARAKDILRLRAGRMLARESWAEALERIAKETKAYADRHQLRSGIPKGELKSLLQRDLPGPIFDEALETLLRDKRLVIQGDRIGLPEAAPTLTPEQSRTLAAIEARLLGAGFQPPETAELLRGIPPTVKPTELIRYLVDGGRVVRVTSELLYPAERWAEVEDRVRAHFTREPTLTMAVFKGTLQVSRKYAVPILEHLDRTGFTRREGDVRVPGPKLRR